MPLKGKILNTWEASSDEALASQEVQMTFGSDWYSIWTATYCSQLRYGKSVSSRMRTPMVCTLPTLLCALFVKHFRALVKHGHV
ncbi:hypothetical protein ACLK19_20185 [Escherichia coli]